MYELIALAPTTLQDIHPSPSPFVPISPMVSQCISVQKLNKLELVIITLRKYLYLYQK